MQIISQ